jgi:hypothetical protein
MSRDTLMAQMEQLIKTPTLGIGFEELKVKEIFNEFTVEEEVAILKEKS